MNSSTNGDVLKYGPATFRGQQGLNSGGFANPLRTRIRYRLQMGVQRHLQMGLNLFNILNSGRYTEWHRSGANLSYDPAFYLTQDNQQTSRSAQFDVAYRF